MAGTAPGPGPETSREAFHPVTRARLADLVRFSELRGRHGHGKFAYCSCMRWRLPSAEFQRSTPAGRRAALYRLVEEGTPVGVLGYLDGEPVGWCSIAPRETYRALERFRALARIDDEPVWSAVCFFLDARVRRQGFTGRLLQSAVAYALAEGARTIEAYPVEPGPRLYTYMGAPSTFLRAGFRDVTPPGRARRLMRYP